jgi:hypothetical protein
MLLGLLLLAASPSAFPAPPKAYSLDNGYELGARVFWRFDNVTAVGELGELYHFDAGSAPAATVGVIYRPLDWLRLGGYVSRVFGIRHDEDWTGDSWIDPSGRGENILTLEAAPRTILPWSGLWMAELRVRAQLDTFNHDQTLVLRPGLTYAWLRGDDPFVNFFAQVEGDIPLNYGVGPFNQLWFYLGALFFVNPTVQLTGYTAVTWQQWGGTPEFEGKTSSVTALVVGGALVLQLGD